MLRHLIVVFTLSSATLALARQEPLWIAPSRAADAPQRPDVPATACPLFRKTFSLPARPAAATLRIVGLGHYELRVNGKIAGTTVINQPWSQYNKSIYVQEFDIAPMLREGDNSIGVSLGNSFWRVAKVADPARFSKTDAEPDFSAGEPFLLWVDCHFTTAAGETRIVSDDSWRWTDGPITFSHIYAGEDYDARLEQPGWDAPGFNDSSWLSPRTASAPNAALVPFTSPGLKTFETFAPTEIREPRPGVYTVVFPQNCSSLLRFTVEGRTGDTVRFKPCEYMDDTGAVRFTYTWGTKKDIWHDYTLKGGGPESHQIVFCYVGAQFVEVTGAVPAGKPNPNHLPVLKSLELVHTRADCPTVGLFTSSSDLQNRAHAIIDWAIRSNFSHVATDCPHREKNGWQEQNWHMARSLSYMYDTDQYMTKLLHDVRDTQLDDGHIPTNCPNYLVGIPPHGYWNEAPEWGVSGVLVPWHLYEWYGDKRILANSFDSMKRYVAYLSSTAEDGIITSNLGDWYDYGHGKGDGNSQWTPAEVSATLVWALAADTVAKAALVLNMPQEADAHRALFNQVRADFQRRFYDSATATVKNNGSCQAGTAAALCIGLIPDADRPRAIEAIVRDLEQREYQQTPGEVLHVFLIRALADAGRNDILHKVYARDAQGSYGYMVKTGLTTLPESWSGQRGTGNSLNHFMLGHLVEWHFEYFAENRHQPGSARWKYFVIPADPGPIESVDATFKSPAGDISVSTRRDGTTYTLTATIPPGVEGTIVTLPDGTHRSFQPGRNTCSWPAR